MLNGVAPKWYDEIPDGLEDITKEKSGQERESLTRNKLSIQY